MKKSLQIILIGYEWDRLLFGLKQFPPKKAIIICSRTETAIKKEWASTNQKVAKELVEKIAPLIETELVYVDYNQVDDCLTKLIEILETHIDEYDEITLNISSGTKPLITAAVLASQYYPINLFYVIPEEYNLPADTIFQSKGAIKVVELPTFELKEMVLPSKKQTPFFIGITSDPTPLSEIIKKYAQNKSIKMDPDKMRQLKPLFLYHLKKLKQKKLIATKIENKNLLVSLSYTGKFIKNILDAKEKKHPSTAP